MHVPLWIMCAPEPAFSRCGINPNDWFTLRSDAKVANLISGKQNNSFGNGYANPVGIVVFSNRAFGHVVWPFCK